MVLFVSLLTLFGRVAQLVRALGLHPRCRGFEPRSAHQFHRVRTFPSGNAFGCFFFLCGHRWKRSGGYVMVAATKPKHGTDNPKTGSTSAGLTGHRFQSAFRRYRHPGRPRARNPAAGSGTGVSPVADAAPGQPLHRAGNLRLPGAGTGGRLLPDAPHRHHRGTGEPVRLAHEFRSADRPGRLPCTAARKTRRRRAALRESAPLPVRRHPQSGRSGRRARRRRGNAQG